MSLHVNRVLPASMHQRRAMMWNQSACCADLARFRISLGPSQQHRAGRVRRESTLTLRVAQQRATASSAASANTQQHLEPRQRQHARVVQRARHRPQAATMKQTAPTCVRQAIQGPQERVCPATQAPTRQPLEAGPACHVQPTPRAHRDRPPASARQASSE